MKTRKTLKTAIVNSEFLVELIFPFASKKFSMKKHDALKISGWNRRDADIKGERKCCTTVLTLILQTKNDMVERNATY